MDDAVIMKLEAIQLTDRRPQRRSGSAASLKALEQKLRKFFDEADGHGSLLRKPPPSMITAQYFKIANTVSCYPIKRMDWISLVNSVNYKKKLSTSDEALRVQRPSVILQNKARTSPTGPDNHN